MSSLTLNGLEDLLSALALDAGQALETPIPAAEAADVLTKPLDIFRSYVAAALRTVLPDCEPEHIHAAINTTNDVFQGDLAVVLPRLKLKDANYEELAVRIARELPPAPLYMLPFSDGIHIRIFFNTKSLYRLLVPYINDRKGSYGQDLSQGLRDLTAPSAGRKKIIVEFSSPNLGTEFADRHLRSTLIGAFISNIYQCMGWDVVRLNFLGDWGRQIGLLLSGWERFGSEETLDKDGVAHILDVYDKISELFQPEQKEWEAVKKDEQKKAEIESQGLFAEREAAFKKMEDGDTTTMALWKKLRDVAIEHLTAAYERLGIKFDEYSGESQVKSETVAEVETLLKEKGVLEESDGAWIIDFPKHTTRRGIPTAPLRNRFGATTYLLRDIATVVERERAHSFDRMIYVVSAKQETHFAQVFAALELMGRPDLKEKVIHVSFGGVTNMAAQIPGARLLGEILDSTAALMHEEAATEGGVASAATLSALDNITAVSALLAQDMSGRRGHGYAFDGKKLTTFSGHTGLRLQTGYGNLRAMIASLKQQELPEDLPAEYDKLHDEALSDMLRLMAQYPDVLASTFRSLEPHTVSTYLFRMVDFIEMTMQEDEADDGASDEAGPSTAPPPPEVTPGQMKAKLLLFESARQVLENGMKLLGFPIISG